MRSSVVNGRGAPSAAASAASVEVWSVFVDDEEAADRCSALLPLAEQERLSRLVPPHRHRRTCAHAAVRILASAALGEPLPVRSLIRTAEGRLALAASPAPSDPPFDISLSYAGGYAAVALSGCGAVGVDIEPLSTLSHVEERRLARFSLAGPEYAQWCNAAPELRARLLTRAWTRKEAVLKAIGLGLAGDVRTVQTQLTPSQAGECAGSAAVRIHGLPGAAGQTAHWTVLDLPDEPEHLGSVAVRAASAKVRYRRCGILDLVHCAERGIQ
jgi:4'-phosphopantetheinyl transferase